MRTNPTIEAAARVLAERWCTDYSQIEAAMRTTRADATALYRAGLLNAPTGPQHTHGDLHPATDNLRCVDADRGIYRAATHTPPVEGETR